MTIDLNTAVESFAGVVTAVGSVYGAVRHFMISSKRKRESYQQFILEKAKEELTKVELSLNDKIKVLELDLANHKESISNDIFHMKEVYNTEIKVLGQRIEELRQDLSQQHQGLVNLLTRLIDK